jgi:hypothetical protein
MTNGEFEGFEGIDPGDAATIQALLADPAIWEEPPPGLEDRVVAAIEQELATVTPIQRSPVRAKPKRRNVTAWAVGLVAVAAAAAGLVFIATNDNQSSGEVAFAVQGTDLAPDAHGKVTAVRTESGWRIDLDATGLPRADGDHFYQAWLRNADGMLVAIGTFNEGRDVVLWAGVSPRNFPTLTVTLEPNDGNQASSGKRVLAGTYDGD